MTANKKNTNLLVVAITVLVVALLAWNYIGSWESQRAKAPVYANAIKDLPTSQVPSALPQDIVLAKDAQVLHSYTATTPQGNQQSTIIYTTKESLQAVAQAYAAYFKANDWASSVAPGQVTMVQIGAAGSSKQQQQQKSAPITSETIIGIKSDESVNILLIVQATSTLVSANLLTATPATTK